MITIKVNYLTLTFEGNNIKIINHGLSDFNIEENTIFEDSSDYVSDVYYFLDKKCTIPFNKNTIITKDNAPTKLWSLHIDDELDKNYFNLFIHFYNKLHNTRYDNKISRIDDWTRYYRALLKNEMIFKEIFNDEDGELFKRIFGLEPDAVSSREDEINTLNDKVNNKISELYPDIDRGSLSTVQTYSIIMSDEVLDACTSDKSLKQAYILYLFILLVDGCGSYRPLQNELSALHEDDYTREDFITIYLLDMQRTKYFKDVPIYQNWVDAICSEFVPLPEIKDDYVTCTTLIPAQTTKEDVEKIIAMMEEYQRDLPISVSVPVSSHIPIPSDKRPIPSDSNKDK